VVSPGLRPNRLWLTDITEHPTYEGKVYCAVVLEAFSRRVVGWSIDSSQTANLVVNALGMAIENRQAKGVVIHSDRGGQGEYTSWAFTRRALDSGLVPSMCQGPAGSARWRTVELPGRGQQNCPVMASSSAR
jgi:putative transposase